ncbi:GNAT family N-acetyltransferase [Ulvibacterium sp.]|uniref:GNAT family N-acetyltransferase n=1 Tax=Ulvibacterium sp. TaxID=2665914 RepID=UPI0026397359|nr:GNAT family N-acetyltransferase [Ulvibacterium sp.]
MNIRLAVKKDLLDIVSLLANDKLGKLREDFQDPLPKTYDDAFDRINSDPNQELVVIVNDYDTIIGTLQLSFIPYLTYQGGIRAQIEAVRVHEKYRGQGIGQHLFEWAIERAKEKGAHLIQLTTDKKRPEAFNFYKRLGFINSHEGMKLHLL